MSKKNGLAKSLVAVIIMVLVATLTLTGCTDNSAQQAAKQAHTAANAAQSSADAAKSDAVAAQNTADEAKNAAAANKTAIEALPDDKAVATAVTKILKEHLGNLPGGDLLTEDAIADFITADEVSSLVKEYAKVEALSVYVQNDTLACALADYVKTGDLGNFALDSDLKAAIEGCVHSEDLAAYVEVEKLNKALAGYVENGELASVLSDYVQIAVLEDRLAACTKAADLEKAINDAKAELNGKILEEVVKYVNETIGNYEDATDYVAAKVVELENKIAELESEKNESNEEVYSALIETLKVNKVRLMRAVNLEKAKAVVAACDAAIAEAVVAD